MVSEALDRNIGGFCLLHQNYYYICRMTIIEKVIIRKSNTAINLLIKPYHSVKQNKYEVMSFRQRLHKYYAKKFDTEIYVMLRSQVVEKNVPFGKIADMVIRGNVNGESNIKALNSKGEEILYLYQNKQWTIDNGKV